MKKLLGPKITGPYTAPISLYCDGGVIADLRLAPEPGKLRPVYNPSYIGGTWAWCAVDANGVLLGRNSGVIPAVFTYELDGVSNNLAEWQAAVRALEAMPQGVRIELCSDSEITIGRLFWNWSTAKGLPNTWVRRGLNAKRQLGGTVRPVLLEGHPTRAELRAGRGAKHGWPVSEHNVWCDKECSRLGAAYRDAWYALQQAEPVLAVSENMA